MELLNYIFKLGVVFAIFGFLWGIIFLGYNLLRTGSKKSTVEHYFVKLVQYFLLVDVTFIFGQDSSDSYSNNLLITALILLTYFIGKLQRQQNKTMLFQMAANKMPVAEKIFDIRFEVAVILLALGSFIALYFYPEYAENRLSTWFYVSIQNIEDTPVFGFIFKVIGFFFLVGMLFKMFNTISFLLSGKPFFRMQSNFKNNTDTKQDDRFDDFEELE